MKKWLSFSLIVHLGSIIILWTLKPLKSKPKDPIPIKVISQKQLEKILKDAQAPQIVNTSPQKDHPNLIKLDKIFLGKDNQITAKNTQAPKSDKFNNSGHEEKPKITSITQKGKFNPQEKGKGISSSDDFILGAEIGPMTILNTQEFKYFSYYDRIKEQVVETWRPLIRKAIQKVKSNEKEYGVLEPGYKVTKLEILLNAKGEVLEIRIVGNSGYQLFDNAAKESFKGPFASPPLELVKNGRMIIRWDYTVNVQAAGLIQYQGNN